jgi:hypothetical protein
VRHPWAIRGVLKATRNRRDERLVPARHPVCVRADVRSGQRGSTGASAARDEERGADLAFYLGASDEDRTRTISLGTRPERPPSPPACYSCTSGPLARPPGTPQSGLVRTVCETNVRRGTGRAGGGNASCGVPNTAGIESSVAMSLSSSTAPGRKKTVS